jgi:hypothetical protein
MLLKNLTEMFANSVQTDLTIAVGDTNLNWVYFIRTILNECGFTYKWETENVNNNEWIKYVVKQRLLDQFVL